MGPLFISSPAGTSPAGLFDTALPIRRMEGGAPSSPRPARGYLCFLFAGLIFAFFSVRSPAAGGLHSAGRGFATVSGMASA